VCRLVRRDDAHARGALQVLGGEDLRVFYAEPALAAGLGVGADRCFEAIKSDVVGAVADTVDILVVSRLSVIMSEDGMPETA
jgi:hypothetical protein